jgi:hypothetical protein
MEQWNAQTHPWRCSWMVGQPSGGWKTRREFFTCEQSARAAMDRVFRSDVRKAYVHEWTDGKWWRMVAVRDASAPRKRSA